MRVCPKYIQFIKERPSKSGKTKEWTVTAKDDEWDLLGTIAWHGSWRQYSFYPAIPVKYKSLVFEKTCLRDIANFCEKQTKLHNNQRRLLEEPAK